MPIDPNQAIQAIETSVGMVPTALLVIALLAGPTLAWLLYRFVVQPRTSRYSSGGSDLLWVCSECRSANDARHTRCYRCGLDREAMVGALQVFDGDGLVTLGSDDPDDLDDWTDADIADDDIRAPVPVMAPVAATRPAESPALASPALVTQKPPTRLVAVGPGRTATKRSPARPLAERSPAVPPGPTSATAGSPAPKPKAARRRAAAVVATVDEVADPAGEA